jgi:8-oxo-dGTP pyrophosphatase MutT (NUDIX family)
MGDGARPASTVLVVRDGTDGLEVYLQRRPAAMRFVGGFWVFPGGRVDDADRDPAIDSRWSGPPPGAWAQVMDVSVDLARGHLVAAYRETLEEAGILLTADRPSAEAVAEARRALLDDDRAMVDVITDLDVRLDATVVRYWGWWVTPVSEPRRYDTRFFVARLPDAAVVTPHTGEVVEETWATGADVDALHVIAPTYYTMRDALAHPSVDTLLADATRRTIAAVRPTIEDGAIVLPWNERFPLPEGFGDA